MRRRLLVIAALLLCVLGVVPAASAAGARILPILRSTGLAGAGTGVSVIDVDTGEVVFTRNAGRRLIPASNEKLVTGVAALNKLGPSFRFATVVAATGRRTGTTWQGDLYLIGSGDPTFGRPQVATLARQLRSLGIRRVTGRIVGDETIYDRLRYGPLWKAAYIGVESPPLSGLSYNRNTTETGRLVSDPARAAARALRRQLVQRGVAVGARLVSTGRAPAAAEAIVSVSSAPLWKITRFMGQESDNFTAEMLVKAVGAYAGNGGTTAAGIAVARTLLAGMIGGAAAQVRPVDGSGLSRANRASAGSLARLLVAADDDPRVGPALDASLAVAGVNGTLERRLTTGPGHRRMHGKTGSLLGVSSLSGYVRTQTGHRYAFSILMNATGPTFWRAHEAQDRIVATLAAGR